MKRDQRIVSVGMTRLVDFASNIGVAATEKEYRNRGYATSIVSALVREILKTSPTAIIHVISDNAPAIIHVISDNAPAIIHVISDNAPAIRAYSKVGFKPYRTYLSLRT